MFRGCREEMLQQSVLAQEVKGALAESGKEEFLELVEQPRRRNVFEQVRERCERRASGFMNGEPELRLEADGSQHPDRVLPIACLGIPDQADRAGADVLEAADVVPDREVLDVVVQRIAGEVAAPDILVDSAVDVVAKQASAVVVDAVERFRLFLRLAPGRVFGVPGFAVVLVHALRHHRHAGCAKCRHLDDLVPEADVREPEAPADQPAVSKQPPHLFGRRIRRNVEVLRDDPDQEVAHASADEEGLVARVPEAIENLEGVAGNL